MYTYVVMAEMRQKPPEQSRTEPLEATLEQVNTLRKTFHPDRMFGLQGEITKPLLEPRKDSEGKPIEMTFEEKNGSPKYMAVLQLSILNDVVDKEGAEHVIRRRWNGNFRPDGKAYFFVRRVEREDPETKVMYDFFEVAPEAIELPNTPEQFVRALWFFQEGKKTWDEVKQELIKRPQRPKSAGDMLLDEFETEAGTIQTLDDALRIAKKIYNRIEQDGLRMKAIGAVSRALEKVIDAKVKGCANLEELKSFGAELKRFFDDEYAQGFMRSRFLDYLDAGALAVGKRMIAESISPDDLTRALEAFRSYPFAYAGIFEAPLKESREDATAKLDLLAKIRNKKEPGLDALMKEVEVFPFKSKQFADQYRAQIYGFIERKRAILRYRQQLAEGGFDQELDN